MWPFRRKNPFVERMCTRDRWRLDDKLIRWSRRDAFTLGNAFENVLITGATGSGKTSGSGAALADALLRAGCGGLVLTAKADETRLWKSYCRRAGRLRDLVIFGPEQRWRYNALNYELQRPTRGGGRTENIVQLLSTLAEIGGGNARERSGGENAEFFRAANEQLCRNLCDLLAMSVGRISIPDMYEVHMSAPKSKEQLSSDDWKKSSFCVQCLLQADKQAKTKESRQAFDAVLGYWGGVYPNMPDKTRGGVDITFSAMFDALNRGLARELFCGDTNITPEAIENGKIIVIDLPIMEFQKVGLFAQGLWKYAFQRCVEQRDIRKSPRPVFLWADEAQFFLTPTHDMHYLSTCRGYRAATVFLTQSISSVYAALGGQSGVAEANSLFTNLVNKFFHCNDSITNAFAAELIGRTRQYVFSANSSYQPSWYGWDMGTGNAPQINGGITETWELEVQPRAFTTLRTGGRKNKWKVDAIIFQNGHVFDTQTNWRRATFRQRF
jgi:type IV secretory pathway TraG/TraD family ATPase VirD4